MAERKSGTKATQKSAKSTTAIGKRFKGFTDEERAAMKDRVQEMKAAADKADGESAVLAKIAEMAEPDRAMAKRLHAVIKASAPALSPRLWYGMPRMPRTARLSASSKMRRSSRRGTRRSVSATRRTSMTAPCGRPPTRCQSGRLLTRQGSWRW